MQHKWSEKQYKFLVDNAKGIENKTLTEIFNKEFNLNLKVTQIKAAKKRKKISSGLDGKFQNGKEPWNKGLKGASLGGKATQFKKGNRPHNYMPIGSERVNGDGYVDIKIADPNKWRAKHHIIWEEHNGPVPGGHAIIFGDGNNRKFDINNLILVSRQQLLILNRNNLIQNDADLTRTGVIVADIYQKMNERKSNTK